MEPRTLNTKLLEVIEEVKNGVPYDVVVKKNVSSVVLCVFDTKKVELKSDGTFDIVK